MVFPDPYKLFSALAFFLFVFATFPLSMFNSMGEGAVPAELKYFVSGIFLIAYSISFIEFMKGGSL